MLWEIRSNVVISEKYLNISVNSIFKDMRNLDIL